MRRFLAIGAFLATLLALQLPDSTAQEAKEHGAVLLRNGSWFRGRLATIEDGEAVFASPDFLDPVVVPLDGLSTVFFNRAPNDSGTALLALRDGSILCGTLLSIDDEKLLLDTEWTDDTITVPLELCSELALSGGRLLWDSRYQTVACLWNEHLSRRQTPRQAELSLSLSEDWREVTVGFSLTLLKEGGPPYKMLIISSRNLSVSFSDEEVTINVGEKILARSPVGPKLQVGKRADLQVAVAGDNDNLRVSVSLDGQTLAETPIPAHYAPGKLLAFTRSDNFAVHRMRVAEGPLPLGDVPTVAMESHTLVLANGDVLSSPEITFDRDGFHTLGDPGGDLPANRVTGIRFAGKPHELDRRLQVVETGRSRLVGTVQDADGEYVTVRSAALGELRIRQKFVQCAMSCPSSWQVLQPFGNTVSNAKNRSAGFKSVNRLDDTTVWVGETEMRR